MTPGYVFRIKNPATVYYLQRVGQTGELTEVHVSSVQSERKWHTWLTANCFYLPTANLFSTTAYMAAILWTITAITLIGESRSYYHSPVSPPFQHGWSFDEEVGLDGLENTNQGLVGTLIVLLSQDRWIRMRGMVDLKGRL